MAAEASYTVTDTGEILEGSRVLHPTPTKIPERALENAVAYSVTGSHLYNLATHGSDTDYMVITRWGVSEQVMFEGKVDVTFVPFGAFVERVMASSTPEVMVLAGGQLRVLDANYRPVLRALRWSPMKLYDNLRSQSWNWLERLYHGKRPHTVEKVMRVVARDAVMRGKALTDGLDLCSHLDQREVDAVDSAYRSLKGRWVQGVSFSEMWDFVTSGVLWPAANVSPSETFEA